MIEAYEIGIRLALQDGVSDGIAAIRRDLGSLDQAIAQTTLRLSELQRIGVQALAAAQGEIVRAASVPVRRPAPVAAAALPESEPVAPAVERQAVVPVQTAPVRSVAGAPAAPVVVRAPAAEAAPVSPMVVARQEAAAPVAAARPPVVVVGAGASGGSGGVGQPAAMAPAARVVSPPPIAAVVAAARQAAPRLRVEAPLPREGERSRDVVVPRLAREVSPAPGSVAMAPQRTSVEPERRDRVRQAGERHEEVRHVHARHVVAVSELPAARVAPAPARPAAVFAPAVAGGMAVSPSYAPPAASQRGGETRAGGDVFLDGTRVGRWMSEQMARDAGRPNTGPTGFDPRRSPAWPGAAVTW